MLRTDDYWSWKILSLECLIVVNFLSYVERQDIQEDKMNKNALLASLLFLFGAQLATSAYAGEKDVNVINTPDVNIVNPSLQVTGEVTSTVSGDVNATVTNTVDATVSNNVDVNVTNSSVPVDVQNMIDIQSLPAIQIEPNQQVVTIPALRPGAAVAFGLACSVHPPDLTANCVYAGFPSNGGILTHISVTPRYSGSMGDTVCNVNVAVGGANLISHSWNGSSLLGTHIVLPFTVQMGSSSGVPGIFIQRAGTGSCVVSAGYHGYRP